MQLTIFGVAVIAIGLLLLFTASRMAMMLFVLLATLLGGSAAILLPALGGSTIPPAHLSVVFLILRLLAPSRIGMAAVWQSLEANMVLVFFVVYSVFAAIILPRIFQNALLVTPLRPNPTRDLFAAEPLRFTNQNLTVSVYMLATLLSAVGAYVMAMDRRAQTALPRTAAIIGSTHALLGIASVTLKNQLGWLFGFFRNGFYAQLDQSLGDISRMNGIFPEPSIYAAFGFSWLVLLTELWLRHVEERWTGPAAGILAIALLFSTSSTAYLSFAIYGLILGVRMVLIRGSVSGRQAVVLMGGALFLAALAMGLAVVSPESGARIGQMIDRVTVGKVGSESSAQRLFWAKQGFTGFAASYGLGIGPGSFRSSSLPVAILGSVGALGTIAFAWHLVRTFMPLRRSTWQNAGHGRTSAGAAASWAALVTLIPLSFSAASPDPGMVWGAFTGLALGLRSLPGRQRPHLRLLSHSAKFQTVPAGPDSMGAA